MVVSSLTQSNLAVGSPGVVRTDILLIYTVVHTDEIMRGVISMTSWTSAVQLGGGNERPYLRRFRRGSV